MCLSYNIDRVPMMVLGAGHIIVSMKTRSNGIYILLEGTKRKRENKHLR